MKRSRIRPVSLKRARQNRERGKLIAELKRDGPVFCVRCGGMAEDLHEPGKRSQGADPSDREQVIPVCRPCHSHIHENVAESVATGWLHGRKA